MDKRKLTIFKFIFVFYLFTVLLMIFKLQQQDIWKSISNCESQHRLGDIQNEFLLSKKASASNALTPRMRIKADEERSNSPRDNNHYKYGPGINSSAVIIPKEGRDLLKKYFDKKHGFNTLLSDVIGLHRQWKDCPNPKCAHKMYSRELPKVSVVIIFRDEHPSIVLRTAYSVLEHSNDLIEEVILVDDGSINEELKLIVNIYVANEDKLKLVTNESPLGLMMARQRGIEKVSSDYFVVMDGHMEVCDGWLKPLITRLLEEPKAVVSPCVAGISALNFEISGCEVFDGVAMYFSPLTLGQAWVPFKKEYIEKRNGSVEPIEFPVMQGMILAMRKDFFFQLGGFDPGMKVWGTEQMELSVKVWMCGGSVEMIPCSRVGHMFRVTQWLRQKTGDRHIQDNKARFAAVWMDGSHREAVLTLQSFYDANPGNVSDRVRIRQENNCKPYSFFTERISKFIDVFSLENAKAMGPIRNALTDQCVDNLMIRGTVSDKIGSYNCIEKHARQYFILTELSQIRFPDHIFFVKVNSTEINVKKSNLMDNDPNTIFKYTHDNNIVHQQTGLCVTSFLDTTDVRLVTCDGSLAQSWIWRTMS